MKSTRDLRTLRSCIGPIKRVARMLRAYRKLLPDWFHAKKTVSSGVVEALNRRLKLIFRKSYGFRTFRVAKISLYYTLRALPEPEWTHRLC